MGLMQKSEAVIGKYAQLKWFSQQKTALPMLSAELASFAGARNQFWLQTESQYLLDAKFIWH